MTDAERIFAAIAPMLKKGEQPGGVAAIAGKAGVPKELAGKALAWMADEGWVIRWRGQGQYASWQYALPAAEYQVDTVPEFMDRDDAPEGSWLKLGSERYVGVKERDGTVDTFEEAGKPADAKYEELLEGYAKAIASVSDLDERVEIRKAWNLRIEMETGVVMAAAESQEGIRAAVSGSLRNAVRGGDSAGAAKMFGKLAAHFAGKDRAVEREWGHDERYVREAHARLSIDSAEVG